MPEDMPARRAGKYESASFQRPLETA